jgi:glycosyltransferase involved in cell wall biosynthesis
VLLNAWRELHEQYPLQIVGDGPDRATLQAQTSEWQLSGITFRGRLSREEVNEAIKGARFLIVPSTLYEGFPMCIVESFACGTPVLCSRLGGLAEIVQHQSTGLHFQSGDSQSLAASVEWAWNHPREVAQMGRTARTKYECDYTAEKNYALLMEIYEQALAARASRRRSSLLRQPAISKVIQPQAEGEAQ